MRPHVLGCFVVVGVVLLVFVLGAVVPMIVEVVLSLTASLRGR